jgi:pimeloyl-ACP methyl ester carboxylesterase
MREHSVTTASGLKLNVADDGRSGTPVVLLHGVTRRWQDWLGVLPQLVRTWRPIAIDLRGHGRSDRAGGAYRIVDYVPDLLDFLRRGLDEPAIVIGHSLGGNLAAAVAAEAPDRVRALVLEDPPLVLAGPRLAETPFLETFHVFARHAGSARPVAEIAQSLADARMNFPGSQTSIRLGDIRDAVSLRFSASCLKRLDPAVLHVPIAGKWLDGSNTNESLGRIECPTLLIQADTTVGGILPDREAGEAARLIRDCLHVKLTGIGHNIHPSATEAMIRLVVPFLASLD